MKKAFTTTMSRKTGTSRFGVKATSGVATYVVAPAKVGKLAARKGREGSTLKMTASSSMRVLAIVKAPITDEQRANAAKLARRAAAADASSVTAKFRKAVA
jgi:hypothetical protein